MEMQHGPALRELSGAGDAASGLYKASQVALVVKNPPANAGDIRDTRSIPGSLGGNPIE